MSAQGKRVLKALFIVVTVLLAALAIEHITGTLSSPVYCGMNKVFTTHNEGEKESVSAMNMMDAALKDTGAVTASGIESLPAEFSQELFEVNGCSSVQVNEERGLVGFVVEGKSTSQVLSDCSSRMVEHGWTAVGSAKGSGLSFVKRTGAYRWSFMNATPVGSSVSLVVVVA